MPRLCSGTFGEPRPDRSNYRGRRMTRGSNRSGPSAENQRELDPRPLITAGASRYTLLAGRLIHPRIMIFASPRPFVQKNRASFQRVEMRYGPALSPSEWQVRGLAPAAGGCGWTYDPSFRTNRDVKHTRSRREII